MEDEEDLYGYSDTAVAELPQPGIYDERAPQLNSYQAYDPRAPQLNRPTGDVDWNYVNRAVAAQRSAQMVQMRRQQAEAKAEQDAVRFQGVQEYGELIKGGATPQEALRRTAGKINYQNPAAILQTTRLLEGMQNKTPLAPKVETIDGVKFWTDETGKHHILPYQNPRATTIPKTDSEKNAQFTAKEEYKAAMREYNKVKSGVKDNKGKMVVDPDLLTKAARRLRIAEGFLNPKTETVAEPPVSAPPTQASSGFKEGALIRSKKNGKLYKVVGGQPELVEE